MNTLLDGASKKFGLPGLHSYGGPDCAKYVEKSIHIYESLFWIAMLVISYVGFDMNRTIKEFIRNAGALVFERKYVSNSLQQATHKVSYTKAPQSLSKLSVFEKFMGLLHLALLCHLLLCKIKSEIVIFLLQPCHLILLFQTIALLSESIKLKSAVAVYCIPAQVGALLAITFPDTSGLDLYLETEAYWVQHVLITLITPIFILLTTKAYTLVNFQSICTGAWIIAFHHWVILEFIDFATLVNIDFMLCPTSAMESAFSFFPPDLFWPSYRTIMCAVVLIFGFPLAYLYKAISCTLAENSFLVIKKTI